jgi:hypothetical protein
MDPEGLFKIWNAALDAGLPVVGPMAFAVFVFLSRIANDDGQSSPSKHFIARSVGVNVAAVNRAIATLSEADGALRAEGVPPMTS